MVPRSIPTAPSKRSSIFVREKERAEGKEWEEMEEAEAKLERRQAVERKKSRRGG